MSEYSEKLMFLEARADVFSKAKQLRSKMTRAEFKVWNFLKGKNVLGVRFKAQHPLGIYIADFFSFKLNLVIEIDGEIHNSENQKEYDSERSEYLKFSGIDVIRFTNSQVMSKFGFVQNSIIKEVQKRLQNIDIQQNSGPL